MLAIVRISSLEGTVPEPFNPVFYEIAAILGLRSIVSKQSIFTTVLRIVDSAVALGRKFPRHFAERLGRRHKAATRNV